MNWSLSLEDQTVEHEGVTYKEEWRSFRKRLHVSNFGRIKRISYTLLSGVLKPALIMKISKSGKYLRISRHDKSYSIHRLVCQAFHPNPENRPQVNHKDAVKWNNYFFNLEWSTQSENIRHAQSLGIMPYAMVKEKLPRKKMAPRYKKIINIDTGEIIESSKELSNRLGVPAKSIGRMLSGERYIKIPYRHYVKGQIIDNVKHAPPKIIKEKPVKQPRPPKKVYEPHPLVLKKISQYSLSGKFIKQFSSVREAAISVGCKTDTFRKSLKVSPRKFKKGFLWKYD